MIFFFPFFFFLFFSSLFFSLTGWCSIRSGVNWQNLIWWVFFNSGKRILIKATQSAVYFFSSLTSLTAGKRDTIMDLYKSHCQFTAERLVGYLILNRLFFFPLTFLCFNEDPVCHCLRSLLAGKFLRNYEEEKEGMGEDTWINFKFAGTLNLGNSSLEQ